MATTHRSDLVDELEKALHDEAYDGGMGALGPEKFTDYVRGLAVTAARVVEQAHTPTDNEREALIEQATWALIEWDTDTADRGVRDEHYRDRRADVERVFPLLFRRSEVPESSAEPLLAELSAWKKHTGDTALANLLGRTESALHRSGVELAAMTAEKEKWRIRCAEETIAWADEATENRRLLASGSQGEPSDAQAEEEANRRWPHTPGDPVTASARSARRLSFRQGVIWARSVAKTGGER